MYGNYEKPNTGIIVLLSIFLTGVFAFYIGYERGRKSIQPEAIKLKQEKMHLDSVRIKTEKDMEMLMDSLNYESLNHFLLRRSIDNY